MKKPVLHSRTFFSPSSEAQAGSKRASAFSRSTSTAKKWNRQLGGRGNSTGVTWPSSPGEAICRAPWPRLPET